MYLPEGAVRGTLRAVASDSAPGTALVMDFAGRATIDMLEKFPHLAQHNYTTHWGEPWLFGVPDSHENEFFRECGLELRETLGLFGREAAKRYLTRADGTSLGRVRGGAPRRRQFSTVAGLIWMLLTRRSKWYALAELVVPAERLRLS